MSRVKAAVLTAPTDLTLLLMEAEELHGKGLVSEGQMREACWHRCWPTDRYLAVLGGSGSDCQTAQLLATEQLARMLARTETRLLHRSCWYCWRLVGQ